METQAQVDTSSTYLQAIRYKHMVNERLLFKYYRKLDTSSVVFINLILLEPLEKGLLAHHITSDNFFDKVKLVSDKNYNDVWIIRNSDPAKFLGHIWLSKPQFLIKKKKKPEFLISTLIIDRDSLEKGVSLRNINLYKGAYGQYDKCSIGDVLYPEVIAFLLKNSISTIFEVSGAFAFHYLVVKNGRLYFLVGLQEMKLIEFDEQMKEKQYVLDVDSAKYYNEDYGWSK